MYSNSDFYFLSYSDFTLFFHNIHLHLFQKIEPDAVGEFCVEMEQLTSVLGNFYGEDDFVEQNGGDWWRWRIRRRKSWLLFEWWRWWWNTKTKISFKITNYQIQITQVSNNNHITITNYLASNRNHIKLDENHKLFSIK